MKTIVLYKTVSGQIVGMVKILNDTYTPVIDVNGDEANLICDIETDFNPDLFIVKDDQIVRKPVLQISLSKCSIAADGMDEAEIYVSVKDCYEKLDSVLLSIANQEFIVSLNDNNGSITFSSTAPGKYIIECQSDVIKSNTVEVIVDELDE